MRLKDKLRKLGLRKFETGYEETATPYIDTELATAEKASTLQDRSTAFVEIRADGLPPENDDPERPRIIRTWRTRSERIRANLARMADNLRYLFGRAAPILLTEEEKEIFAENKRRHALDRSLRYQAQLAAGIIQNASARLKLCAWSEDKGRHKVTQRITFTLCEYSPNAFRYYVDASALPWGVSIEHITNNPHLTQTLSAALRHPVVCETIKDEIGGTDAIITVEIAGTNEIQNKIEFRDVLKLLPQDATPLTFPLGVSRNGIKERRAIEGMPHMILAGETGGGKSNMTHVIINTIIARNKPEDVQLILIDLKYNGLELSRYKDVPHVLRQAVPSSSSGIATNLAEALEALTYANSVCDDRGDKMVKGEKQYQNIEQWNKAHRTRRFSRIVVVIDELAEILDKSDADTKEEKQVITLCRQYFKKLLRMARSQGVHILGATQSLDKSVMGVAFKVNTAGRICFSVSDANSSMLVVNDGSAVNLGPAGRAIFKRGTDKILVQTPLITPADMDEIIKNAEAGTTSIKLHGASYTPQDIVTWAVQENLGSLAERDIHFYLNRDYPTIEMTELRRVLDDMEGKTFTVFDYEYKIVPGAGRRPRHAARILDDQMPAS